MSKYTIAFKAEMLIHLAKYELAMAEIFEDMPRARRAKALVAEAKQLIESA